jgi:hypothetical protein
MQKPDFRKASVHIPSGKAKGRRPDSTQNQTNRKKQGRNTKKQISVK